MVCVSCGKKLWGELKAVAALLPLLGLGMIGEFGGEGVVNLASASWLPRTDSLRDLGASLFLRLGFPPLGDSRSSALPFLTLPCALGIFTRCLPA